MTKYKDYCDAKFAELKKNMATKDCIQSLRDTIFKENEEINVLQSKVEVMEKYVYQLEKQAYDQEQYNRRLCLHIDGIALEDNETAERCFVKVKDVFEELEVSIPEDVVDRAHRIGKPKIIQGKRCHTLIVRFTTWRHGTIVYRARKNCPKYKIRLDMTKKEWRRS